MTVAATQANYSAEAAAAINGNAVGGSTSSVQEMSDRFLKLLVTQLKNQDPMNPMENAELTTQLAQMSTVEGVNKLNDSLDALNAQFRASQVIQGASLVGHQVLAEGDYLPMANGAAVGGVSLDGKADSVKVDIFDANGNLVKTLDLGKQDEGLVRFVWDGKDTGGNPLANGDYSFQVAATAGGKDVAATSYALGQVMSVALKDGTMEVEVSGLGNMDMGQIRQIF
ncbi:MAG: flagellar hook assembly protein FlgD [Thiobacillus sp.]|nr:flagellar hook assembly protein FlgD [Thiobacillus sp.]